MKLRTGVEDQQEVGFADTRTDLYTTRPHLILLGALRVEQQDGILPVPSICLRLLAYIALIGTVSRGAAAGMLWPDSDQERAFANLRTTLWRIQRASSQLTSTTVNTIALHRSVTVDARELAQTAQAVLLRDNANPLRAVDRLTSQVTLLPDLDDEWVILERERHRQLQLHALETLADRLCEQRRFGEAAEAALAAVRIEPLRESSHRALIRVHLAEGNLIEARRQYDHCDRLLQEELGVRPTSATSKLLTS